LWHVDWAPFLEGLLRDLGTGAPRERLARRFHRALVDAMVAVAALSGIERVVLSGGCFQNGIILESVIERLRQCGHRVYWHQRVPTNDGGLALGQAVAGLRLKNGAAE
jgi:hydrogenase maturation protein HypF